MPDYDSRKLDPRLVTLRSGLLPATEEIDTHAEMGADRIHAAVSVVLREGEESGEDFPAGTRLLLDEANPLGVDRNRILGDIASAITVEDRFRTALEAVEGGYVRSPFNPPKSFGMS